jgi:hypothetical protein
LRIADGVAKACLLSLAILCGLPVCASAQAWLEAYQAGEYARAASLLQPIVRAQQQQFPNWGPVPDPEPSRHLASLYARGLGVTRDPLLACALAQFSNRARRNMAVRFANMEEAMAFKALLDESESVARSSCGQLTADEERAALLLLSCFQFDVRPETFVVGSQTVTLDRFGLRLNESDSEVSVYEIGCEVVRVRFRLRTIEPPADAAPGVRARAFVELVYWRSSQASASPALWNMVWRMIEIRGGKLIPGEMVPVASTTELPDPTVPADFDTRLAVEMIRSGHIRWRLDGRPPKRGWMMLDPENGR